MFVFKGQIHFRRALAPAWETPRSPWPGRGPGRHLGGEPADIRCLLALELCLPNKNLLQVDSMSASAQVLLETAPVAWMTSGQTGPRLQPWTSLSDPLLHDCCGRQVLPASPPPALPTQPESPQPARSTRLLKLSGEKLSRHPTGLLHQSLEVCFWGDNNKTINE